VLAHLANFAYDPINYKYLLQLNVVDLFLDNLESTNSVLKELAIGGICNFCLDPRVAKIIRDDGLPLIMSCLSDTNLEIVLSAVTSLIYLLDCIPQNEIATPEVLDCMTTYTKSPHKRLVNLCTIFLHRTQSPIPS